MQIPLFDNTMSSLITTITIQTNHIILLSHLSQ
nr:MAG TPA: hypothetical protein [Caudoviricetes sp.]